MSGGDGKDSRGPTGGVKGGPTGIGGPNVGHGGTLTDTINGVTMTFEGVHALDSGSGIHWGGDSGNNGNSNGGGSSLGRNNLKSIPSHPNVVDSGQLAGDNGNKHEYFTRVGDFIYSVLIDQYGNEKGTFQVSRPKNNENDHRTSWAKGEESRKSVAREQVKNYLKDEKEFLMEQSSIIADAGEKVSGHVSGQYKRYADEVANNIRNFQGKTIRN